MGFKLPSRPDRDVGKDQSERRPETRGDGSLEGEVRSQHDVLQLQRSIGNQATMRRLSGVVQRPGRTRSREGGEAGGRPLPPSLRAGVEALSGESMGDVRVHDNSPRPAQVAARAYTLGSEIHVAAGAGSVLPHEAWHVVQQKQGRVRATMQKKGFKLNDDGALEAEADARGAEALAWGLAHPRAHAGEGHGSPGEGRSSPAVGGAPFPVMQRFALISDDETWQSDNIQRVFTAVPEMTAIRDQLLQRGDAASSGALRAACRAAVLEHPALESLLEKYKTAERARIMRPDDTEAVIGAVVGRICATLEVQGEFDDDDALELPVAAARTDVIAAPRLPGSTERLRSGEEKAADLERFKVNIDALRLRLEALAPEAIADNEEKIEAEKSKLADAKLSAAQLVTTTYNKLPPDIAEYWKKRVSHESLLEGLTLIVEKAEKVPETVNMVKFNALFDTISAQEDDDFKATMGSLMQLAPNHQDLMELVEEGVESATLGINCGKTIGRGFNLGLDTLSPPEVSEIQRICMRINKRMYKRSILACVRRTAALGGLSEDTRKVLIGRVVDTMISFGDDRVQVDLPMVTPEAVAMIRQTLREVYNREAVIRECRSELTELAARLTAKDPKKNTTEILRNVATELSYEGIAAGFIGASYADDGVPDFSDHVVTEFAIKGNMLVESPDAEVIPPDVASDVALVKGGTLEKYPAALGDVVPLDDGLRDGTNLYLENHGKFSDRWGRYNRAANHTARDTLRAALLMMARRVLVVHLPAEMISRSLGDMETLFVGAGPYKLSDAQKDFTTVSNKVRSAIVGQQAGNVAFERSV